MISQTFIISEIFAKEFIELINSKYNDKNISEMTSDKVLNVVVENSYGEFGRIDMLFELKILNI